MPHASDESFARMGVPMRSLTRLGQVAAFVSLLTLPACDRRGGVLEGKVPPSLNTGIFADVRRIEADPLAAAQVNWPSVRGEIEALGLSTRDFSAVALLEVETFEDGRGGLFIGVMSTRGAALSPVARSSAADLVVDGLEFRASRLEGWFITSGEGWIAACDQSGCRIAAPVLIGDAPSLFDSPPDLAVRPLLGPLLDDAPVELIWIPLARTRDAMEATTFWTGAAASAWMRSALPAQVLDGVGAVRGVRCSAQGQGRRLQSDVSIALSSTEAAQFLSGSLNLLRNLGAGADALSKALGGPASMPSQAETRVESKDNIVRTRITK